MQAFVVILAALVAVVFCKKPAPIPPLLRTEHSLRQRLLSQADADDVTDQYPWVVRSNFKQKVDHFNPTNTATWDQRYYYNPKYARNTSIIFLMIGGEGPENGKWAGNEKVQYLQWASEFGAHVFDLEHRFFGDSWPIKNMNFDSLSLLTTEQALADLAYFITSMNQKYGFNNPRWVTFGGSYPEWTVGAVASSAPLNLTLDFYEYAQVVQDDLTITNKDCPVYVEQAFQEMKNLSTTTAGRQKLNKIFNLQPPFTDNSTALDITNFFANVYNVFQSMTQYTYDGRNAESEQNLTDAKLCQLMMNPNVADVVTRVYDVYIWYNEVTGDPNSDLTVFPNSYTDMIKSVSTGNLSVLGEDNAAARGWMWLCCNEVGFMQTTRNDSIFGGNVPLDYYINMCSDMFDPSVNMSYLEPRNKAAQTYYGGSDKYQAHNVVLPNGSLDPWHALGCYLNNTAGVYPILINATAHCSDMYPAYDGEPQALVGVREQIKGHVRDFIKYNPAIDGPTGSTTSVSVSGFASLAILLMTCM
ncbi:unnamed protein product [Cylicocyclus nassatus]|uniref:Serine protease K12H4.7 n=1 Tax=Cylicocyclus nassatus TaxID=53992 RepID=A0AA36MF07_CYLNA|nr:unnamed protein product [Cylicocyclus nassatus]